MPEKSPAAVRETPALQELLGVPSQMAFAAMIPVGRPTGRGGDGLTDVDSERPGRKADLVMARALAILTLGAPYVQCREEVRVIIPPPRRRG
jgi:hypothetical protein